MYRVRINDTEYYDLDAESHGDAALQALRLERPRDRHTVMIRTTGEHRKSGYYVGYRRQGDGMNRVGPQYHVSRVRSSAVRPLCGN